jgi:hypothetical protein
MVCSLNQLRTVNSSLANSSPCLLVIILSVLFLVPGCKDGAVSKAIDNLGAARFLGLKKDEPPVLQQVIPIELEPAQTTSIPLSLDRKGNEGPIALSLEGLPQGITGAVGEMPAGSSSTELTLQADASLGDDDLTTTCTLTATTGTHTARVPVSIRVRRVPRPSISIDEPFILQPGTDVELPISVQRNGWEGKITLAVEQCTDGITVSVPDVSPEATSVPARMTVATHATEGMASFLITWTSYGRKMTAHVPLVIARTPLTVGSPVAITLKPSASQEARIRLRRPVYRGPVAFALEGLPDSIHATSEDVQADENEGTIMVNADPTARAEYTVANLRATGGHLEAEGLFVIRILDDVEASSLPPAVVTTLAGVARPKAGGLEARLSEDAKEALDRFYGTTSDSKPAVINGLRWLASTQTADGGWEPDAIGDSLPGGSPQPPSQDNDGDDRDGRVALAVLAFLAEGIGHEPQFVRSPEFAHYADVVKKALVYLARRQVAAPGPNVGRFGKTLSSHVHCLTAFSEAYALSENEKLKLHAKKAADYLVEQQAKNGGWGDANGSNALDTAQALVALRSAKACKVGVSALSLRKAEKFLATCFAGPALNRGSKYSLRPGDSPHSEATAAGLLAALYAASKPSPDIIAGCDFLADHAPALHASHTDQTALFLLLVTQVLRNVEGEGFDRWNAAIRTFLTENQLQEGDFPGSWDPNIFGNESDGVRTSSLATLILQTNYRHLPLFRTGSGDNDERGESPVDEPSQGSNDD